MNATSNAVIAQAQKAALRLPEALRTNHWYNDWQHAVFIILFDHLVTAERHGKRQMTDRHMDKLTVYMFVHFLCEEEGMTWSVGEGHLEADMLKSHQGLHVMFLDYWHRNIQGPYKQGHLGGRALIDKVEDFYHKVLEHIENADQATYGVKSNRTARATQTEIAHIAQTGLPLSPNMRGAGAVVSRCCDSTYALLKRELLPRDANSPLRQLSLVKAQALARNDTLRDRFVTRLLAA